VIADFKGLRDLTARPSSLVLVEVRVLCASVRCAYFGDQNVSALVVTVIEQRIERFEHEIAGELCSPQRNGRRGDASHR